MLMICIQVIVDCKQVMPKGMAAVAAAFLYLWAQHNIYYFIRVVSEEHVDTKFTELLVNSTARSFRPAGL